MNKALLFFLLTSFSTLQGLAQGQLSGNVIEEASGEPVLFGNVALYKADVLYKATETDLDGNYNVDAIEKGLYEVKATYLGLAQESKTVFINDNEVTLNLKLGSDPGLICGGSFFIFRKPLIDLENTTSGQIIHFRQGGTIE